MSYFSKVLTNLLNKTNITQSQLSKGTGISPASLSRYIAGSIEPRIDIIQNIAKYLNVDPSIFVETNRIETNTCETIVDILARNGDKLSPDEKAKIAKYLFGGK